MAIFDTALYKGGTFDTDLGNGFRRIDAEVIKKDLLNHIRTPLGSRVMMPSFGTTLYDMVFDPNDEITRNRIASEVEAVLEYDPRVELIRLTLTTSEDEHIITVDALIRFVELEIIDNLKIDLPTGA